MRRKSEWRWWMFLPIFWPVWALVCFYWSYVILTEP